MGMDWQGRVRLCLCPYISCAVRSGSPFPASVAISIHGHRQSGCKAAPDGSRPLYRGSVVRVDSGRGQNHTLRPLWTLWPPVFAGEQDVGPPKGWDVGQELGLDHQPGVFPLSDRFAEMGGIPAPIGFGNET